jgi:hypothetical protein
MRHLGSALAITVVLAACSAGSTSSSAPGSAGTPPAAASTPAPGDATPAGGQATAAAPQQNAGDNKSRARALIPNGATQLTEVASGNVYSVQVSSTQSLDELGSFFTQAIPAAGLHETGRFTADGSLTIAFTNPDGGIVATEDPSSGGVIVTISVGTP